MQPVSDKDAAGQFNYRYPREGNEAHRWRCMKRNMRHDERIDKEAGQRLLEAARGLPSCTPTNYQELLAEFNERFGEQQERPESRRGLRRE
jgi:hypothetical protein